MESYLINNLDGNEFVSIITLLDYKIQISKYLASIKRTPYKTGKLLVDTLLCSGMNEYRFIEVNLKDNGTIDLDKYNYVDVDNNVLERANSIIKQQSTYLCNSVLPQKQVMMFTSHSKNR